MNLYEQYGALLDSYEPRWESRISLMAQGANCAGEVDGKKKKGGFYTDSRGKIISTCRSLNESHVEPQIEIDNLHWRWAIGSSQNAGRNVLLGRSSVFSVAPLGWPKKTHSIELIWILKQKKWNINGLSEWSRNNHYYTLESLSYMAWKSPLLYPSSKLNKNIA